MKPFGKQDAATGEAIRDRGYQIDNVFDIGASTSVWTRTMRRVLPDARFDMFEPLAQHNDEYGERLKSFLSSDRNANLHEVAIGSEDGDVTMIMTPKPVGSTIIPLQETAKGTRLTVPVRSVDSLVAAGDTPVPDLIKADIQGGEMGLLQGARETLPEVKFLLLETWLTRGYGPNTPLLVELMRYLAEFQFFPYELGNIFNSVHGYAAAIDVWFINRNLAITPKYYYANASEGAGLVPGQTIIRCSRESTDGEHKEAGAADRLILHSVRDRDYAVDCVFDIGASNAEWSAGMVEELGASARFELFEPLAEAIPAYREQIAGFRRSHSESTLHTIAAGDRDGTIELLQTETGAGSTMLSLGADLLPGKIVEVPVQAIDAIVESGTAPQPDLIRLAIQGGELRALRGASKVLEQTTFLAIETWFVRAYGAQTPLFSEIAEHLLGFGFVPFEFGDVWRGESDLLIRSTVWFFNTGKSKAPPWYYTGIR